MRFHRILDRFYFAWAAWTRSKAAACRGVLLISAGGLGDTVLVSRVVERFMALAQPDEPVTLLLRSDALPMAFLFPPGLRVEGVDYRKLRRPAYRYALFRRLRRAGYRLVVHTDYLRHPDLDEALVRACGAVETVAMVPRPSKKHARALARACYTRLIDSGPPQKDKVLRLAGFADALRGRAGPVPRLVIDGPAPDRVTPDRATPPVAVLQPFSAVALKQSAPALWRRIIDAIPAHWDIRLSGHPKDLERNPDYQVLLDRPNIRFEDAPFAQLAAILRSAAMVVSVDTACLHLAVVMGAPTLCLGSAAYVGEIVPYDARIAPPNVSVLHAACPSMGCLGACVYAPDQGRYPCVAALDADLVLDWVKRQVAGV